MNLGLRSLSSSLTDASMSASSMFSPSSSISTVTPMSPSAMPTSIIVSPTSSFPISSPSITSIMQQSSSETLTSISESQKSSDSPSNSAAASSLAFPSISSNMTISSHLTPSSTTSSHASSTAELSLEISASALQTSDSFTQFLPTNTMLTFPSVPTSVSPCVTTCLQNAIESVNCVTITSVECYCGKPQFISSAYNCVESQCPANFDQAVNIAEEFCALVSTSLTFPSPTATFTTTNSTSSSAASTTRDALQPKALSTKLLVSSLAFMAALYALQN